MLAMLSGTWAGYAAVSTKINLTSLNKLFLCKYLLIFAVGKEQPKLQAAHKYLTMFPTFPVFLISASLSAMSLKTMCEKCCLWNSFWCSSCKYTMHCLSICSHSACFISVSWWHVSSHPELWIVNSAGNSYWSSTAVLQFPLNNMLDVNFDLFCIYFHKLFNFPTN